MTSQEVAPASDARLLEMRDVHAGYAEAPVLRGASLTLHAGERLALFGSNGAGKSTLLRVLVGLVRPIQGSVWAFGRERTKEADFVSVRQKAGLVFQDADDQLVAPTVLEDVAFGPRNHGLSEDEAKAQAQRTLSELGLEGFESRLTHRLSGGEKRLVALAGVLAMKPEALLLDEPFTGLDVKAEARVKEILAGLRLALLVVTHDVNVLDELTLEGRTLEDGVIL